MPSYTDANESEKKKKEAWLICCWDDGTTSKIEENKVYAPDGVEVGLEVKRTVGSKLLPTSVNLGRITWVMKTNIWLLALMFVLNIQIFDIYIWLLVKPKSLFQVTNMISEGRNHVPAANTNLLYFTL